MCVCVCVCVRVPAPPPRRIAAARSSTHAINRKRGGGGGGGGRLHARERRGAADHRGEHVEPALCDELGLQGRMYYVCIYYRYVRCVSVLTDL